LVAKAAFGEGWEGQMAVPPLRLRHFSRKFRLVKVVSEVVEISLSDFKGLGRVVESGEPWSLAAHKVVKWWRS
jgi:hypothetical protein